jgi:hypothetical protein
MRALTWWSCGESVAGNDSKSARVKHAKDLHIFSIFLQRSIETIQGATPQ